MIRPSMILASLCTALLQAAVAAPSTPAAEARSLIERLEQRQGSILDLTARFTQVYRSASLGQEIVERGQLRMKRPGRMRWDYAAPDKKLFVADGKTFFFYVPADRQVVVTQQDDRHSVAAILLGGRSRLLDEFSAASETGAPSGLVRVRLTPRTEGPEIHHVLVDIDPSLRVRSIHVVDSQGNTSRFDLADVRENVGLSDSLFRFEMPAGVEVIEG